MGWDGVDSRKVDQLGKIDPIINPYADINVACTTQKLANESLNDPTQVITIQPAEFKPSKKKPCKNLYPTAKL
jgi:hypothetical protein